MATLPKKIEKVPEVEADIKDMEIEALRAEIAALKATKPETNAPVRNPSLTEVATRTKEDLKKAPKVKITVPLDMGNPDDAVLPISINGYTLQIRKGVETEVPEPIAEAWRESYARDIKAAGMVRERKEPLAEL